MPTPAAAGASISKSASPLLLAPVPARASTASSRTAGTVWSSADPCERCERRLDLCERVCTGGGWGLRDRDGTAGSSMSRSKMAELDEWIDEGDEGRERWWPCSASAGAGENAVAPAGGDALGLSDFGTGWKSGTEPSVDVERGFAGRAGEAARDPAGDRALLGVR
jgi:hypothetical protein